MALLLLTLVAFVLLVTLLLLTLVAFVLLVALLLLLTLVTLFTAVPLLASAVVVVVICEQVVAAAAAAAVIVVVVVVISEQGVLTLFPLAPACADLAVTIFCRLTNMPGICDAEV